VLSLLAALGFLAALSAMGMAGVRHISPFVTTLEVVAYGPVIGTVTGTVLLLGLAEPLGLGGAAIAVSIFSVLVVGAYWPRGEDWFRGSLARLRNDLGWLPGLVILLIVARLALLWSGALSIEPDGLWAGHQYIWGDWTVHLGDTTSFAYGDNFPPTHPRLAGAPLAYHYMTSLTAAGMVAAGLDPTVALPIQSFIFSVVLVLGLYAFGLRLTGDRAMATLALVLFMLGGSLGWVLLFDPNNGGLLHALATNPWDAMAQQEANFWWLNPYFALIMSQRAALYGLPLVLLILTVLHFSVEDQNWRQFAFAGAVAGILPLAHLGSFAALAIIAPFLVLLFPQRGWLAFFGVWVVVGGAVLFGVQGGEARSSSGLRWEPGWLADEEPWPWFWIKNLGLLIPFAAVALVSRQVIPATSRRLLMAFVPIFVVANTFILSVVRWDNSKVLLFFYLALVILAAAAVVAFWRVQRDLLSRSLLTLAVATMVFSGVLTNASQITGLDRTLMARTVDLDLADWVRRETPPDAIFAVGLEHNDPVPMLTGRPVMTSYQPWLRNIGLDSTRQEADLRSIYRFDHRATDLLEEYRVDYVVIGEWEERELEANVGAFAERYPLKARIGEYRVFAISDRAQARSP
jgi:hypothetical protein